MLALRGGAVLTATGWAAADLIIADGRVADVTPRRDGQPVPDGSPAAHATGLPEAPAGGPPAVPGQELDVTGCVVAPGFVDLHVHAGGGHPFQGPTRDLATAAVALARQGTTSFLATTFAAPLQELHEAVCTPGPREGARLLGWHLEGPWIAPGAAGAQPPGAIRAPDVAEATELLRTGGVRVVTVAPEVPGAGDLIRVLVGAGVHVSLGHSLATHDEALDAVASGARGITHCFNAMSQLSSREPGLVGLAMWHPDLVVEVIADGVHVHPAAVLALHAARGAGSVALVSDCVEGCHPEATASGRLRRDGDVLRLADGTLAGSALCLADAVRHVVDWGVPLQDALAMASTTPAAALGVDVALRPGAAADVVVLDSALRVRHVLVGGRLQ